jgi:hypothetical protein
MFVLYKTLKLDDLGDEWKDCYLKFREPTIHEVYQIQETAASGEKEAIDSVLEVYKKCFIDGEVWNGKEKEKLKELPIDEFPVSLVSRVGRFLLSGQGKEAK